MEPLTNAALIATVTEQIAEKTPNLPFDLQYLMFLQNWRNSMGGSLDLTMERISDFAISGWLLIALAVFYWCFCKKTGSFVLMNVGFADLINQVVKMSCCIYRPWIRSSAIKPAGDAIRTATGYSFPSGHTQCITSYFGSIAVLTWFKKRWLAVVSALMIAIVAFSRNYLGVHTPEDVVVGCLLCFAVIAFNSWVFGKLGKDKATDTKYFVGAFVFSIIMLVYFVCKNYPMDYVDGKLIVDPNKMMNDAFAGTGRFLGWLVGWYIELYFIKFVVPQKKEDKISYAVVGGIFLYLICYRISGTFYTNILGLSEHAAHFTKGFLPYFFVTAVFPAAIKINQNRIDEAAKMAEISVEKASEIEVSNVSETIETKSDEAEETSVRAKEQ